MVRGRGGVMLARRWKEGPRTLCGVHVRHFPNMFLLMGPQVQEKRERKGREGGERKGREGGERKGRVFLCACGVQMSSIAYHIATNDVLCFFDPSIHSILSPGMTVLCLGVSRCVPCCVHHRARGLSLT